MYFVYLELRIKRKIKHLLVNFIHRLFSLAQFNYLERARCLTTTKPKQQSLNGCSVVVIKT